MEWNLKEFRDSLREDDLTVTAHAFCSVHVQDISLDVTSVSSFKSKSKFFWWVERSWSDPSSNSSKMTDLHLQDVSHTHSVCLSVCLSFIFRKNYIYIKSTLTVFWSLSMQESRSSWVVLVAVVIHRPCKHTLPLSGRFSHTHLNRWLGVLPFPLWPNTALLLHYWTSDSRYAKPAVFPLGPSCGFPPLIIQVCVLSRWSSLTSTDLC